MKSEPKPRSLVTLLKSAAIGVAATIVDLVALFVLVEGLDVEPLVANLPALALGLVVQFVGNKYFAFSDHSKDLLRQGGWFLAIEAGAFALNALMFHLLVTLLAAPYLLARVLGSAAVYFGFSFPLWGRIFQPTPATSGGRDN